MPCAARSKLHYSQWHELVRAAYYYVTMHIFSLFVPSNTLRAAWPIMALMQQSLFLQLASFGPSLD
eukprot:5305532-Pyramimonas_sp.AAC.4